MAEIALTMLVAFLLLLPWRIAAGNRADERTPRCPFCGYDTTGLPSAQCPECGTTPSPEWLAERC